MCSFPFPFCALLDLDFPFKDNFFHAVDEDINAEQEGAIWGGIEGWAGPSLVGGGMGSAAGGSMNFV